MNSRTNFQELSRVNRLLGIICFVTDIKDAGCVHVYSENARVSMLKRRCKLADGATNELLRIFVEECARDCPSRFLGSTP